MSLPQRQGAESTILDQATSTIQHSPDVLRHTLFVDTVGRVGFSLHANADKSVILAELEDNDLPWPASGDAITISLAFSVERVHLEISPSHT